jgi:hypothetical protein
MDGNSNINVPNPAEADAGVKPARACVSVPLVDGDGCMESVAEERSIQIGTPVKSADQPNKGGRPRKSYDYLIGTTHNFLVIDRIFRGAEHEPYADTTCTRCGTHTECRLRDILKGHTKSCKCLRPEQYLINVNDQAERLPEQKVAEMWSMHYAGATRWDIAWKHKLAAVVVDFALRRYQRFLDGYTTRGLALWLAEQTIQAVPAKVAEYLRKSELRVQNIFRRARNAEAEANARFRVEDRIFRQYMSDHSQFIPFDPTAELEIS